MNYSIVWKIREGGVVTFRRELEDMPNLPAALEAFRREEPDAYILRAYAHTPVDPWVLAEMMEALEKKALADGWRSLGD